MTEPGLRVRAWNPFVKALSCRAARPRALGSAPPRPHWVRWARELGPFLQHFEHENVHLVSHAANDLSLTVLVDGAAWDRLVQQLHDRLFDHGGCEDDSFGPSWESLEVTSA